MYSNYFVISEVLILITISNTAVYSGYDVRMRIYEVNNFIMYDRIMIY